MSYLINTLLHPISIFLAVLIIFIGFISYYFNNKIKEQNLKIESIASVVSTMALQMQNVDIGNLNTPNINSHSPSPSSRNDKIINLNTSNIEDSTDMKHSLIHVSDSDENSSSDDEPNSPYESESDGYGTDDSEETMDNENNDDNNTQQNKKIFKHDYTSMNIDENIIVFKIDPLFNQDDSHDNAVILDSGDIIENVSVLDGELEVNNVSVLDNIKIELKEDPLIENLEFTSDNVNIEPTVASEEQLTQNQIDLENVDILLKNVEIDYKKLTLNKLKEIALEKGLIDESTKLKKQDLLKLLTN